MKSLALFLILSLSLTVPSAFAQEWATGGDVAAVTMGSATAPANSAKGKDWDLWGDASQFMYNRSHEACPKAAGASDDAAEKQELTNRAKDRVSSLECNGADVEATRNDPEKSKAFGADLAKKLILIMGYQKAAQKESVSMSNNAQPLPSMAPTAEYQKHKAAYLDIVKKEEATLNSIPYIQTHAVRDFVRDELRMYSGGAREEPSVDEVAQAFNKPSGVASVLKRAQGQIEREEKNLNKAVDSDWADSDHNTKESLVQNGRPITGIEDKGLGCRMDAKYGAGAKARDTGLFVVQMGLVAATAGTGLLADMADGAVAARGAAAAGQISWRTANIVALSGQTGLAIQQIHTSCSRFNLIGGDDQKTCNGLNLQKLRKDNCGLAVTLNVGAFAVAGGAELLSTAGKSIVASMMPEGLPVAKAVARAASYGKTVTNPLTPNSVTSVLDSQPHVNLASMPETNNNAPQLHRVSPEVGETVEAETAPNPTVNAMIQKAKAKRGRAKPLLVDNH